MRTLNIDDLDVLTRFKGIGDRGGCLDPTRAQPTCHPVALKANSRLAEIFGKAQISVVSWHHQAIKTLPPNWQLAAQATDGLMEAIEYPSQPWLLAVQWQPEMSIDDGDQIKLFRAFVTAASKHQKST